MIDWKEKYMRDVEGLNNEGDPIGGDSPSGLRAAYKALQKEKDKIEDELDQYKEHHEELTEHYKALQFIESEFRKENAVLLSENAEQAKRIADLQVMLEKCHLRNKNDMQDLGEKFNKLMEAAGSDIRHRYQINSAQKGTE